MTNRSLTIEQVSPCLQKRRRVSPRLPPVWQHLNCMPAPISMNGP